MNKREIKFCEKHGETEFGLYKSALEFHHINSEEKEFGISANGYTRSWE